MVLCLTMGWKDPVSTERNPCPPRGRTECCHREAWGHTLEQMGEDEAQSRQRSQPQ